jgi:NMT1-like family
LKRTQRDKPRLWRFGATGALAGLIVLTIQPVLAASHSHPPAGMVAYAHPVFHNGKQMLWHGAWRGKGSHEIARSAPVRVAIPQKPAPQPTPTASASAAAQPAAMAAQQPLKAFAIIADPDDLTASHMAADFVSVLTDKGAQGRTLVGSTSPNGLSKVTRADMADFAVVTLDSLVGGAKFDPDWQKHAPLVARLAPETLEVIAPKEIKSVADLQGKTVSIGDPDSATATTARLLFSHLNVTVNPIYEPLTDALAALNDGKRGAVVVLGAKSARAIDGFGDDGRYHLVAIPWSSALEQVYAPARVAATERPNLIAANDSVETVAEPLALIALDAAPGTPRAEALGRIAKVFFESYESFLTDERDAHWRDVNLAAEASLPSGSWARLAGVQAWLDERKASSDASLDAFRASATAAADASGGPTADDSDRLYDNLTRWRGLMQ